MRYELTQIEADVIDRMRMTPEEIEADQKQRDTHEEDQLRTRLSEREYAEVLAIRAKMAALTQEQREAESCLQLQRVIVDALEKPAVVAAIRAKVAAGELSANSMIASHVQAKRA
jgi:hypothetical protein